MAASMINEPWVTFCISTYKRPEFLHRQLLSLSQQTFSNFNVVICDNDPEASAQEVIEDLHDARVFYYNNGSNLGMIASFNKAIEKAHTPYIVMLTDDDHVEINMLTEFYDLVNKYPGYPIYLGCKRANMEKNAVEIFNKEDYVFQLLDPDKTQNILWSSCLLETHVAQSFGGIPDFGSPHFADHALLAICGKNKGGLFVNKMYGALASHDQNFSKSHFDLYYKGCLGFYQFITSNFEEKAYKKGNTNALVKHLHNWFLSNYFILIKYFTYKRHNKETLKDIRDFSNKVLKLPFMRTVYRKYLLMRRLYMLKKPFFLIKYRL